MTPEERDLIAGLANRLRTADTNPKDREAEQFIRQLVAEQPSAPYLLVQTVLVQEHALTNAQSRISTLERQVSELSAAARKQGETEKESGGVGSFLSGLLGGSRPQTPAASPTPSSSLSTPRSAGSGPVPPPVPRGMPADAPQGAAAQQQQPGYPSTMNMPPSAGGGFLKGALATAAGVAGGAMLFQGLQGLMGHNSGPFGGGGFGGFGGGGGHLAGGGHQPLETGSHDVINNYYGDTGGGGSRGAGDDSGSGLGETTDAESHSDMLMQSSEPVDDSGGGDYRTAEMQDFGNDESAGGSDNLFADSGSGDSSDSGGGGGDGDYV